MRTLRCVVAWSLLCLYAAGAPVWAQESADQLMERALRAGREGRTLQAISLLESSPNREANNDLIGTFYACAGDGDKARELRPAGARRHHVTLPADVRLEPALETIARLAHGRQIVIINESHDAPEHRAFISRLLEVLKADGVTHYAMETLSENPKLLVRRGYPVLWSGFYLMEPRYGELVRESLQAGLIPVAYEASDVQPTGDKVTDINNRDAGQCRHLVDRLFAKQPQARVLIHVGLDHVQEEPRPVKEGELLWLAAQLKRATGVDPLTIDQISTLQPALEGHADPVVALDSQGQNYVAGPYKGAVDLQVYHPAEHLQQGRPDWLLRDSRRRTVALPADIPASPQRLLVLAYYASERSDAIPADQFLILPTAPRPVLSLKPGEYRIVIQNEQGEKTAERRIQVD